MMRREILAAAAVSLFVLGGCASNSAKVAKANYKQAVKSTKSAMKSIPSWYVDLPKDEVAVYSAGTATTPDLQMSLDVATMNAKRTLADRLNGKLRSQTKSYQSTVGNSAENVNLITNIERTSKNLIADTVVSGYTVDKTEIIQEGPRYRVYVLLKYNDARLNVVLNSGQGNAEMLASSSFDELDSSVEGGQ
tara:strand:- start:2456 stop:3031 length:576 start_codon:yes stop_codon:yes gene_type:complete